MILFDDDRVRANGSGNMPRELVWQSVGYFQITPLWRWSVPVQVRTQTYLFRRSTTCGWLISFLVPENYIGIFSEFLTSKPGGFDSMSDCTRAAIVGENGWHLLLVN